MFFGLVLNKPLGSQHREEKKTTTTNTQHWVSLWENYTRAITASNRLKAVIVIRQEKAVMPGGAGHEKKEKKNGRTGTGEIPVADITGLLLRRSSSRRVLGHH